MKRYNFVVLLALALLLTGFQPAFSRADTDRGNAVPGEALPVELKDLDVQDYYIAYEAEPVGLIQTVTGHVVVLHEDTDQAYFAAQGDAIFQQDILFTLEDSRCRVKFVTEDVITMGEDTRIGIEELIDDQEMEEKKSTISILRGKAMFYVVPLFRYKNISTSVETPTAVCGVRGTKFGVEVRKAGENFAQSKPIYLADASDSGFGYLALAQTDYNETETIVYGFDGEVEVYSPVDETTQTVGEGENLEMTSIGAGVLQDTDPAVAEQFMSNTEAPALGAVEVQQEAATETIEEVAPATDTTDTGGTAIAATDTGNTDVTQNLTASTAESGSTITMARGGYFSALLTEIDGANYSNDVYVNKSLQDFDGSEVTATSIRYPNTCFLKGTGKYGEDTTYIKQIVANDETEDSGDLGTSRPITETETGPEVGSNAYMEWGSWTMTTAVTMDSGLKYLIDNKGYYIHGSTTPYTATDGMSGISGTYSGAAYGTYWTTSNGTDMTGTFGCDVNGNSISNFGLSVSDGGELYSASISGAGGSFSNGSFDISGGIWTINNGTNYSSDSCDIKQSCQGSLYGPNAEHIGGAWGMYYDPIPAEDGNEIGVAGIFQGDKQ